MNSEGPVLTVEGLQTFFFTRAGVAKAVDGVSLSLRPGEILGMVGESGCGKTVTGFSILGLVDPPGRVVGGRIIFQGRDLASLPESAWRSLRGRHMAMIFQDPLMTLNPVLRIDTQMIEAIQAHQAVTRREALERCRRVLDQLGIPAAEKRLKDYPHQFSGGMRQRVAIAIALLNEPALIIADEPTTALDVTIQAQILFQVKRLCRERRTAILWITHDLAVVAGLADRVCVMYAGWIVEQGTVDQVIDQPLHPYTAGLLGSVPARNHRGRSMSQIPGMAPSLLERPQGCPFRPRCQRADPACLEPPPVLAEASGHWARCFHPLDQDPPPADQDLALATSRNPAARQVPHG